MSTRAALKKVKDQKAQVRARLAELVGQASALAEENIATETDSGPVYMVDQLEADRLEEWEKANAEWNRLTDTEAALEFEADGERVAEVKADVYPEVELAKANLALYDDLIKVGQRGSYTNPGRLAFQGHPGELLLDPPLIAMNPEKMVNEIIPIPAVYERGVADAEASYRWAEIIRAQRTHEYDQDGNRLEATTTTSNVGGSIPDLVTDIYRHMFYISPIASLCRIYQTPADNDLPVTRRTALPAVSLVAEDGDIDAAEAVYLTTTFKAYKFAYISQYSFEAARSVEPWQFASELAMDAGIAHGLNLANELLDGNGTNRPQGLMHLIDNTAGLQIANAVKSTAATSGAEIFDVNWNFADYVPIATALPLPYDRMSPRTLVRKSVWAQSIAIITTTGDQAPIEQLFDRMAPFMLDDNVEDETAAGNIPFIVLAANTMGLRFAGPFRMEFSSEYGWASDRLSYKFAQHFDSDLLDTKGARGYKLAAN